MTSKLALVMLIATSWANARHLVMSVMPWYWS